jgi:hypothetical protein
MSEPLRPMSTGELLDRSFALYRRNFLLFVGISAVTHVLNFGYQLLTIQSSPMMTRRPIGFYYYASLAWAWTFAVVVLTVSQAATVKAVAAVHLNRSTSVWASYRDLGKRIISVFGVLGLVLLIAGLITGVIGVILLMLMGLLMVGLHQQSAPSMTVDAVLVLIFFVLGFSTFVTVYVRYALATQACVVEDLRAWAAMKRSIFLSKDDRWRIATVYSLLVVFSWILAWFLSWIVARAAIPFHSRFVSAVTVDAARFLVGTLIGPLITIGMSLLYYDERVRKEAFDLHLMMAALDAPAEGASIPATL